MLLVTAAGGTVACLPLAFGETLLWHVFLAMLLPFFG